jgi:hypothetical protein
MYEGSMVEYLMSISVDSSNETAKKLKPTGKSKKNKSQ